MAKSPDIAFFKRLAEAGGQQALTHFRTAVTIDNKLDAGFDPVTIADRNVETALRTIIEAEFPDHGILGEEFDRKAGDGIHEWVIDPIDGTRAFISGLPVWGILCGLTVNGVATSGMMAQPYTGELYCADDTGCWLIERDSTSKKLTARQTKRLADATLFTTTPSLYEGAARARFDRLEAQVRLPRYGCDCYAFAMLAAGHADIVIEPGLQPYDIVGLIAVVEQAGGVVTTWDGGRPEAGGNVIAAATPELHAAALEVISG